MALVAGGVPVLTATREVLIKYVGYDEWHARILLSEVGDSIWMVITPDGDVFAEDLRAANRDIEQWRLRPQDLSIPYGVNAANVYDFATRPTPPELLHLQRESDLLAVAERLRLGVGPPAAGAAGLGLAAGGLADRKI